MRIIGIDPGYAIVGFGVVDYIDGKFSVKDFGAITTDKDTPFPKRLCEIYEDYCQILDSWKPDALSIERLYFTNNQKTGIDVAQARGIIIMAAAQRNKRVHAPAGKAGCRRLRSGGKKTGAGDDEKHSQALLRAKAR